MDYGAQCIYQDGRLVERNSKAKHHHYVHARCFAYAFQLLYRRLDIFQITFASQLRSGNI